MKSMEIKDTLNSIEDIIEFDRSFQGTRICTNLISQYKPLNQEYFANDEEKIRLFAYYGNQLTGILMGNDNKYSQSQFSYFKWHLSHLFVTPPFQRNSMIRVWTHLITEFSRKIQDQTIIVQTAYNSWAFYNKQGFEYLGNFEDSIYYGKHKPLIS